VSNDDDDEWVKDKPVSVGKVQLDNNTSSKLQCYPLSVSARAEDLSSKAEKTTMDFGRLNLKWDDKLI